MRKKGQSGQILLVIVLVLVLAVTVGVATVSRSVINVSNTQTEDQSQRAFSAAEAGIEQALQQPCPTPPCNNSGVLNGTNGNSSFNYSIAANSASGILFKNGKYVKSDETVDVWLVDRDPITKVPLAGTYWQGGSPGTTLTVYWGTSGDICASGASNSNTQAALEGTVIWGNIDGTAAKNSTYNASQFAVDPCAARRSDSGLIAGSTSNCTYSNGAYTFSHRYQITVPSKGILVRLTPLYAETPMLVLSGADNSAGTCSTSGPLSPLPPQNSTITSAGIYNGASSSGTNGVTATRKIQYTEEISCPSELCNYSLFQP